MARLPALLEERGSSPPPVTRDSHRAHRPEIPTVAPSARGETFMELSCIGFSLGQVATSVSWPRIPMAAPVCLKIFGIFPLRFSAHVSYRTRPCGVPRVFPVGGSLIGHS